MESVALKQFLNEGVRVSLHYNVQEKDMNPSILHEIAKTVFFQFELVRQPF